MKEEFKADEELNIDPNVVKEINNIRLKLQ